MNLYVAVFSFLFAILISNSSFAQENKANTPTSSGQSKGKSAKQKWKEERRQKKRHEKEVKEYHRKLQTKDVRKRMKRDRRKAKLINENKREFFLVRWFSKKR